MSEVSKGHVAVVLLAGGVGSRLGENIPKGMLNIGIKKQLFLFEIVISKLRKTSRNAKKMLIYTLWQMKKMLRKYKPFLKNIIIFPMTKNISFSFLNRCIRNIILMVNLC